MKARKHTFAITVTFDKRCTAAHALREVKDTIHGDFYPTQRTDDEPGEYRVSRIARCRRGGVATRQIAGDDDEFMGHPL